MDRNDSLPPVALVGAGPGDPGLITVAGAKLLAGADVVVHDALVNSALLALAPAAAERIDVGKRAGQPSATQDQINALLVELGRSGQRVVRLKGGDPFVFGRGGEEAEALVEAGLQFIVVPGVTSSVAAAAYAGIPVTHRDWTTTFTLATGHEDPGKSHSTLDFSALARLDSLAFYMSLGNLAHNAQALIDAGKDPATPAAVIERGTWPTQRTVVAPLSQIAAAAEREKIHTPALVVIGPTVALREKLNWFERRPLFGRTFVVTRTRQQASELADRLAGLGGEVIEAPTIVIEPPADWAEIDAELARLDRYDWIVFTSANGVTAWAERMRTLGRDGRSLGRARLAGVGPATAAALDRLCLRCDMIPEEFVAESLADSLGGLTGKADLALSPSPCNQGEGRGEGSSPATRLQGKTFLILSADIARPALHDALIAAGANVTQLAIYRTRPADSLPANLLAACQAGRLCCVTFTSSSTARNFFALADDSIRTGLRSGAIQAACIGPIAAATFAELAGRPADIVPAKHTIPGLVEAILKNAAR